MPRPNRKAHQPAPTLVLAPPKPEFTVSILDPDNPNSLLNLCPTLADRLRDLPPDLLNMPEPEFILAHVPDETDYRLKLRFWDEWQLAVLNGSAEIRLEVVYYGVCTQEFFEGCVLSDPVRLAWMVTPPADYETSLQEVLYRGLARLKDIVALPFVTRKQVFYKGQPQLDHNGQPVFETKIDRGVIAEVRQVIQMLSDRVHGAVVQRHQIQAQTTTLNLTPGQPPADALEALEAQLAVLEGKIRPLELQEGVIDAVPDHT
jgi:hypothetical protein